MSVGSLLEGGGAQAVVWRGPRKTALIKRFMKETFWGRLDYLFFDILGRGFVTESQWSARVVKVGEGAWYFSVRPGGFVNVGLSSGQRDILCVYIQSLLDSYDGGQTRGSPPASFSGADLYCTVDSL